MLVRRSRLGKMGEIGWGGSELVMILECGKKNLKILKTTLITINSYTTIPWVLLSQFGIVKNILYGNLLWYLQFWKEAPLSLQKSMVTVKLWLFPFVTLGSKISPSYFWTLFLFSSLVCCSCKNHGTNRWPYQKAIKKVFCENIFCELFSQNSSIIDVWLGSKYTTVAIVKWLMIASLTVHQKLF